MPPQPVPANVTPLLRFRNDDVEALYRKQSAGHVRGDALVAALTASVRAAALLHTAVSHRVRSATGAVLAAHLALAAAHAALAWGLRPWYAQRRHSVVAALRLACAAVSLLACHSGDVSHAAPSSECGVHTSAAALVRVLLAPPLSLLASALLLPLPLHMHAPVYVVAVAGMLHCPPRACSHMGGAACGVLPGEARPPAACVALPCNLVARLSLVTGKLLRPLPLLPQQAPVAFLSDTQCCQHVAALAAVCGGFVLPALLALWLEAGSRATFLRRLLTAAGGADVGGAGRALTPSGSGSSNRSGSSGASGGASLPASASASSAQLVQQAPLPPFALLPLRMQAAATAAVVASLVPLLIDAQQAVAGLQAGLPFGPAEAFFLLTALCVKVFMRMALHAAVSTAARTVGAFFP